ncbi:MAG: transposase [Rhodobacteraceae bacterium]|nr:transposase [Paracoccaceae bacterium]
MERIDDDVGIDWGSQTHPVCIRDGDGTVRGERALTHSGASRADMADWIVTTTGAQPETIGIAIEVPNGPVVETRLERGFGLHSLNPKQLDRFRDRVSPAGAQDDRRDARVLAAALRTDRAAFRHRDPTTPEIISRGIAPAWPTGPVSNSGETYPQLLKVDSDRGKAWIRDLWTRVPTPAQAQTVRPASITRLLKRHRMRRRDAATVLDILRARAITVAPGTAPAATAHLRRVCAQLDLIGEHSFKMLLGQTILALQKQDACQFEPGTGQFRLGDQDGLESCLSLLEQEITLRTVGST